MPAVEYVVGLEIDLTHVPDVQVQEAVEKFADHLRHDNEHNRPLEHLVTLLGPYADKATAIAAIEGEYGKYVRTLTAGQLAQEPPSTRHSHVRRRGIVVINPHAAVAADADPLVTGRLRQKLAAIEAVQRTDVTRLVKALAHPNNARGAKDASEVRKNIYRRLTLFGGPEANAALIAALATEDSDVIDPNIEYFVRQRALLKKLPDVLLAAWLEKRELVYRRVLRLARDLEYTDEWLQQAPSDLRVQIGRPR